MKFKGLLFDLDGTLIDSNAAVDRSWVTWCERNALNFAEVSKVLHGRPAKDTIKEYLNGASEQTIKEELAWLEHQESTDVQGVIPLPGTINLLNALNENNIPWAIVTSGTLLVATARIKASGIPKPSVLITPERVTHGKPNPEPYLLGASELGLSTEDCIVFEDASAGLNAGNAAGAQTIAVLSQFKAHELPQATAYIHSADELELKKENNGSFSFKFK